MNRSISGHLQKLDVPEDRIHSESFGGASDLDPSIESVAATATVRFKGDEHQVPVAENQPILEACEDAGIRPLSSCQAGICGTCRAVLKEGEVHMETHSALSDREIARGEILTCQALAKTESLTVDFD